MTDNAMTERKELKITNNGLQNTAQNADTNPT